jgi:hypothetical protein
MFLEPIRLMKAGGKNAGLLFLFIFIGVKSFSQGDSLHKDTANIMAVEPKSKVSGQLRYFFMATDNLAPFNDYFAHAISAQAKYERGFGKYFRFAAGASAIFNISSSDLIRIDTLAKRANRYEVQLFDLRYPDKKASYRLEEFYVQAALTNGTIRLGSQSINTPFINPQDGRMRPTFVSGIYTTLSFSSTQVQGGWIGALLPRSISRWHSTGSSIGLNPQGINTDGTPSNYGGHLTSNGIFLAGVTRSFSQGIKVKLWEQYVDKIFNIAMLQMDLEHKLWDKAKFLSSLQYTNQVKICTGGSSEMSKGYFTSNTPAQVISTMTGIESERFEASFNYTRIFKGARFLMPREWGREPFFTFMPRERNEGFGDVQAFVIKTAYNFTEAGLKLSLQAGHFQLPDVKNVALNKYGMPSYNQLNAEVRYSPLLVQKLGLQFLYVYKDNKGNTYQNPGYVFNKVNMALYNVVVNYNW